MRYFLKTSCYVVNRVVCSLALQKFETYSKNLQRKYTNDTIGYIPRRFQKTSHSIHHEKSFFTNVVNFTSFVKEYIASFTTFVRKRKINIILGKKSSQVLVSYFCLLKIFALLYDDKLN